MSGKVSWIWAGVGMAAIAALIIDPPPTATPRNTLCAPCTDLSHMPAWIGWGDGAFAAIWSIEMPWNDETRLGGTSENQPARVSAGSIRENRLPSESAASHSLPFS